MAKTPVLLVTNEDAPAVVVAGSAQDYGSIDLGTVRDQADIIASLYKRAEHLEASPDTIESIRRDLNTMVDAMGALAWELYGLARGIEKTRVSVTYGD